MSAINGVKVLKNGLRDQTGKYYPAHYSHTTLISGLVCITVYAKDSFKGLPAALNPINNSDGRTDYFENDKVRFAAGTDEFNTLLPFAR